MRRLNDQNTTKYSVDYINYCIYYLKLFNYVVYCAYLRYIVIHM